MFMPTSEPTNASSSGSGTRRWLHGQTALREGGWLVKQTGLYFSRGVRLASSLARQRGLRARRGRILQEIGEEVRQGTVPESMRAPLKVCDGYDEEIKAHRDALAAQEPHAGWFSRARRRTQLLRTQSARRAALERLGERGISLVPPERLAPYQAIEADIAGEKARQSRFREPWRALSSQRRMAIHASAILVSAALLLGGLRMFQAPTGEVPQKVERPETTPSAIQTNRERTLNHPQEFAQKRAAAAPRTWLVYPGNPVMQRGALEDWDNFTVGAPVVLKEGNRYRMWYRGCHFIGSEYTCGIGHATSTDGIYWQKLAQPVFVPQNVHENERINSLTLVRAGDRYLMWYSVKPNHFSNRPYATIYLATSQDGLSWQSSGVVLRSVSRYTPYVEPSAFYDGKLFHLWYADYYPSDEGKALLHVTSQDGKHWQIAGSTSLDQLKASPGRLSVLPDGRGGYRAFFAYGRTEQFDAGIFGMLLSADGNEWQRAEAGVVLASRDIGNGNELAVAPAALATPDGLWVWFTLRPDDGAEEIRLAFLKKGTS